MRKFSIFKPLDNKKALGALDLVILGIGVIIVMYFILFTTLNLTHDSCKRQYYRVAQSLIDVVSEQRELTNNMQQHFKSDLDACNYFCESYEIRYYKLVYNNGNFSTTKLGTSINGVPIGEFKFNKGELLRVEIVSSYNTKLARLTSVFIDSPDMRVVGVSEGSIE